MFGERVEKGFQKEAAASWAAGMGVSLAAAALLAMVSYFMFSTQAQGVWGIVVAISFLTLGFVGLTAGYLAGWVGYSLKPGARMFKLAINGPTSTRERSWSLIKTTVASLALATVYLYAAIDGASPLPSWYIPGIVAMVSFFFAYSGLKLSRKAYFLDGVLSEEEREEALSWEDKLEKDDETWGRKYARSAVAKLAPRLSGYDKSTILLSPLVAIAGFFAYAFVISLVWVYFPVGTPLAAAVRNGAMVFVAGSTCWLIAFITRWVAHRRRFSMGATLMEPLQLR